LVVLQNLADSEKVQGLCSEICPVSSHDAYQAVRIKAEMFSDAEEEEYPIPITFSGIKVEPEVSCVSVRWISQIHRYPLFYELRYSKQFTVVRGFFYCKSREICKQHGAGG
jgi:hypothetical protein